MILQKTLQMNFKTTFILLLICRFSLAQSYEGTIENITKDGFYKIKILPDVVSACQNNLDRIRIFDSKKIEVPFVIKNNFFNNTKSFVRIPIVNKTILKDSLTELIIAINNEEIYKKSQLVLEISNTKNQKKIIVTGSNNKKEWFGLVENQVLTNLNDENATSTFKTIFFPKNNFKFIKIQFNDTHTLPINILDVGYFKEIKNTKIETLVTDFKYNIETKNKKTRIVFEAEIRQKIDKFLFSISNPLFVRSARLFVKNTRKIGRKTKQFEEEVASFVLNSSDATIYEFDPIFEKEFSIEIDNKDNQPLTIQAIKLFQNADFMLTNLKANENYTVVTDSTYLKPAYDLAFFVNNPTIKFLEASISNFKEIYPNKKTDFKKPFWQTTSFLWISIIIAMICIVYFAVGILKDLKKD